MKRIFAMLMAIALCAVSCVSVAMASSDEMKEHGLITVGTIYEEQGVRVEVLDLTYSRFDVALNIRFVNESDFEIGVLSGAMGYSVNAINGYMIGAGYVNEDIEAHSDLTVDMEFSTSSLKMRGITEIGKLEIGFRFNDQEDNYWYTGPLAVYTSAHETFDYSQNTYRDYVKSPAFETENGVEKVVFEENTNTSDAEVAVESWVAYKNLNNELMLMVELANHSGVVANVQGSEFCINGLKLVAGTICYESINPGAIATFSLDLSYICENNNATMFGIDEISDVSFMTHVFDDQYNQIVGPAVVFIPISGNELQYSREGAELYNANGISVVYKQTYAGKSEYDKDIYAMFLVENQSDKDIDLHADKVFINGEKVATTFFGDVLSGYNSAAKLTLYSYSFGEYGISTMDQIQTMTIEFKLRDTKYNTIDEFVVDVPIIE